MGELTVTGVDEDVLARLSSRAAAHGQTLETEIKEILTSSIAAAQDPATLSLLAEARRQTMGSIRSKTLDMVYEGRDGLA